MNIPKKIVKLSLAAGVFVLAFIGAAGQQTTAPSETAPAAKQATPALGQETLEPHEKELTDEIVRSTLARLQAQFPPGRRPVERDAHPKTHGLVSAQFIVLDGLPPQLRYGVFKEPHTFDALIRFSAGGVETQPDNDRGGGGMAIKLLGVPGEKILAAERDADTQDFIMINAPTFIVRNLADYELLHQAIDRGDQMAFFRTRPEEAKVIKTITDAPFNNPMQVRYWSMVPYKLGPGAMKYSAKPISRTENTPPATRGPDFLHEAMVEQLKTEDVYFEFMVQLQNDPVKMPIEDALTLWDEAQSPFQRVAIIRIPKQDVDAPGRQTIAENLAFDPWHSLPEHRPLGSMNRARRVIYEIIADFRRKANGASTEEPKAIPW
jgi:hypothetical protein